MPKTRRVRCPYCGFLDVIKWGKQCGHQRYKCKNCDSFFTHRREDISKRNRFIWFKSWIRGKQTIEDISEKSGYSVRQLKYWFHEYLDDAPTWTIQRRKSVNLLIDGTWFPNKVCLVVYRADNVKATLFYRITDEEKWVEIESDLQKIKQMGIRIASVTSDGSEDIIKAVRIACPHAVRQRCLAHIERECLVWLTQHPRTSAGIYLRRLVCQISHIKTHNDRLYWISEFHKWYEEYEEFINQKAVSPVDNKKYYIHDSLRRTYIHIRNAIPDMFKFIDHPEIPKTSNALESFFGHLKDNLRIHRGLSFEHQQAFVKWYLHFNNEKKKKE